MKAIQFQKVNKRTKDKLCKQYYKNNKREKWRGKVPFLAYIVIRDSNPVS